MRLFSIFTGLLVFIASVGAASAEEARWWNDAAQAALAKAGDNRAELVKSLTEAPEDQRTGIAFLIANMPDRDLPAIKADFLLENLELAYRARSAMPWGKQVPEELFLNDVLPYASVTERREPWRADMLEACLPIVAECKTLTEAAQALNANLFGKLKVRYSTQRSRPDQAPGESIASGMASCTGLSILLVDACRSVCVPARVVGIPQWANKPGNHTWVEVWDGDWRFTGACEFSPAGLNNAWFVGDAALAKKDSVVNSIYASSFRRTDTKFLFAWDPEADDLFAENVTDRYTRAKQPAETVTRLFVRVWSSGKKQREIVPVRLVDEADANFVLKGFSKGESADTNDMLTFEVPRNRQFRIRAGRDAVVEQAAATEGRESLLVEIELPASLAKE
jgi:hypothetical protein